MCTYLEVKITLGDYSLFNVSMNIGQAEAPPLIAVS